MSDAEKIIKKAEDRESKDWRIVERIFAVATFLGVAGSIFIFMSDESETVMQQIVAALWAIYLPLPPFIALKTTLALRQMREGK